MTERSWAYYLYTAKSALVCVFGEDKGCPPPFSSLFRGRRRRKREKSSPLPIEIAKEGTSPSERKISDWEKLTVKNFRAVKLTVL